MSWWDKLKAVAKRELGAAKEGIDRAGDALDEALAKKERELEATPTERVEMVLEEIEQDDARLEEIEAKLRTGVNPPPGLDPVPDVAAQPEYAGIRDTLTVRSIAPDEAPDRISHGVKLDGHVLATLKPAGLSDVVADLQAEVMVLDARLVNDEILLRSPTLSNDAAADLVSRIAARHISSVEDAHD